MLCRSLFVTLYLFFWSLCCLFFDLRILITPLVSSNFSYPIGSSWSWLYGNWVYNYMRNPCLSPLTLWVRIPFMAYDRSEVFSGFLTNITEILLKVALCTITLIKTLITPWRKIHVHTRKVFLDQSMLLMCLITYKPSK